MLPERGDRIVLRPLKVVFNIAYRIEFARAEDISGAESTNIQIIGKTSV